MKYRQFDEEILSLNEQGLSYEQIKERFDLPNDSIYQICKRLGIDTSRKIIATEQDIINKYKELKDINEVADFFGYKGLTRVRKALIRTGLIEEHAFKHRLERITHLREQGKTYQEIADELGMTRDAVEGFCHREGLRYSEKERKKRQHEIGIERASQLEKFQYQSYSIEKWSEKVSNKYGDVFELVAVGEPNIRGDRTITVECRNCGMIKDVSSISFRGKLGNRGYCENCRAGFEWSAQTLEKRKQREVEKQIKRQSDKISSEKKRVGKKLKTKQVGLRFCKDCNLAIIPNNRTYCDDCIAKHQQESRKKQNQEKEIRRREREQNCKHDAGITVQKVYEINKGICYLCGRVCDWNDYKIINGTFVVGGSYPTREHVVALVNGGTHTWDNIKLACHSCNSKKGRKYLTKDISLI